MLNFDGLFEQSGAILEPVPRAEMTRFLYWRGANLGAVALSLYRNAPSLAVVDGDNTAHVTRLYPYALQTAQNQASGAASLQFDDSSREELNQLVGDELPQELPSIVLGVRSEIPAIPLNQRHGHLVRNLTLDCIDPYSRQAIVNFFEIKA